MNEKQYNNIVFTSLSNLRAEDTAKTDFDKVKLVLNNMGVAFPNGDPQNAINILATDDYMGWAACTYQEAREYANSGIPTIAVKDTEISIVSADASDEEIAMVSNSALVASADALIEEQSTATSYYAYSRATTTNTYYYLSPASGNYSVDEKWEAQFKVIKAPGGTQVSDIQWTTSNPSVATVSTSGYVKTKKAGTVTITAKSTSNSKIDFSCKLWVRGKRPVFLIHGRTSNSFGVWGANNRIFANPLDPDENDNNHFNSSINAFSEGNARMLYTSKAVQDMLSYNLGMEIIENGEPIKNYIIPTVFNGKFDDGEYNEPHPEGGNLAYYLKTRGYKENVNLFVFNYPNEDAVIYSAQKFKKYIENLISYVRNNGTDEMKTCFYFSKYNYDNNIYKINLVGHSMGGLVSRYYIENLECDNRVDKLITICTPHWGSGYADASCEFGSALHVLCDHDLRFQSAMYGGSFSTQLDCDAAITTCTNKSYTLTDELNYSKSRKTRYYAIAAIDYDATDLNSNNYIFEIPINFNSYQELIDYFTSKSVYQKNIWGNIDPIDLHAIGDNMVGLLSQIGWTEDNTSSPRKKIKMERIFIDVDSNGGNGGNVPVIEMLNMLHVKIPHRTDIMSRVNSFLNE